MTLKVLIQGVHVTTSAVAYHAASALTIIDKFTASNTSGSDATLTVHLVPSGGSAAAGNKVLPSVNVEAGKVYLCAELVGHDLEAGDSIVALASVGSAISIRASGRVA
jgi:hypothetical protein